MFMILLLHANVMSFGMPIDYSLRSFLRSFAEAFTLTPVNIFVLITGYFGTRFSFEKMGNLFYQVIFCIVPISLLLCGLGNGNGLSFGSLNVFNYWFINAYLGLLVFVPLLNAAIDTFNRRQFKCLLIVYYVVVVLCGAFLPMVGLAIDKGYSVLWFIFLYLVGRYVRVYPPVTASLKLVVLFLLACFGKTILIFAAHKGINYVDPFILVQSVCTLLLFARLKIKNGLVNWVASSTTMVYLINLHPIFWDVFRKQVNIIYESSSNDIVFLSLLLLYCLAIYVFAILYDKIRLITWKPISVCFRKMDSFLG